MTKAPSKAPTSDAARAARKPVTIAGLRKAARTVAAHDGLDRLIDVKNTESLRMIRDTDADTIRVLLWIAVTGVHRDYRVPEGRPLDPIAAEEHTAEQMRELIGAILADHPEAITPAALAVADATKAVAQQKPDGQ